VTTVPLATTGTKKPRSGAVRLEQRPFGHWLSVAGLALVASCLPPPRMCAQEGDCGAQASCVAGRCVAHGASPAIETGRRLLFAPVDIGYVQSDAQDGRATVATFGRAGRHSMAYLRFAVPLPPEASVLEAYVLLERDTSLDADAVPIALHAARVVTAWDGRSLSWATQPRIEEFGAPVTRVSPVAGPLVRLDVRDLVQRWRKRGRDDLGLAIVTEGESTTGLAFALAPVDRARDADDPTFAQQDAPSPGLSPFESRGASPSMVGDPRRQLQGPRLEIYVK